MCGDYSWFDGRIILTIAVILVIIGVLAMFIDYFTDEDDNTDLLTWLEYGLAILTFIVLAVIILSPCLFLY